MTSLIDRANQAIADHHNQVLQTNAYLIGLIQELVAEIPEAYKGGCRWGLNFSQSDPDIEHKMPNAEETLTARRMP